MEYYRVQHQGNDSPDCRADLRSERKPNKTPCNGKGNGIGMCYKIEFQVFSVLLTAFEQE